MSTFPGQSIGQFAAIHRFASVQSQAATSQQRLATGSRINRGADDPAGLISSEGLRAMLATLDAESAGIERSSAVADVADGALSEISGLLTDASAATVAMANTAGMSDSERAAYQMEIDSSMQAIDRISQTTRFNGQRVFDGSMTLRAGDASYTIGDASSIGNTTINGTDYRLADVASGGRLAPANGNAEEAQQVLAAAISQAATMRGSIGAFQRNTAEPTQRANTIAFENTAAAESTIRDTDYAAESATQARLQLLSQSAIRMIGISGASTGAALGLLR